MATRKKEAKRSDADEAGANPEETLSFEEAIAEVEEIVQAMEGDSIPLENLLKSYERGTHLLGVCRQRIDEAQAKIEIITDRGNGKLETEPFDPGSPTGKQTKQSTKNEPLSAGEEKTEGDGSDEIRLF